MFSQTFLRGLSRARPQIAARAVPRPSIPAFPPPSTFTPRYQSGFRRYPPPPPPHRKPGRVVHYRWDEEQARQARPFLTTEQLGNGLRSPTTKWIAVIACGSATIFYFSNLETVPVSGRRRFNCYSDATVEAEGLRAYQMIMQENRDAILPDWDRRTKLVRKVLSKLIPASGLENVDWEVHVIDSPEANAFVIPGGKVFVMSGILPITKTEDGLAAVLGHEIAHNLARHAAESMSSNTIMFWPIRISLIFLDSTGFTMGLGRYLGEIMMDLGIMRPASRKQESEADYIGLMMMAHSCYDPKEAIKVWERMEKAQRDQDIPEWISTHPSNSNRITQMHKWLPKAEEARSESNCAVTLGYSEDFQRAFQSNAWVDMFKG